MEVAAQPDPQLRRALGSEPAREHARLHVRPQHADSRDAGAGQPRSQPARPRHLRQGEQVVEPFELGGHRPAPRPRLVARLQERLLPLSVRRQRAQRRPPRLRHRLRPHQLVPGDGGRRQRPRLENVLLFDRRRDGH